MKNLKGIIEKNIEALILLKLIFLSGYFITWKESYKLYLPGYFITWEI